MKMIRMFFLTVIMVVVASGAWAGWVIHSDGGPMMGPMTTYLQKSMMRQEMGQLVTIVDVNKEWIYYLNTVKKTYWGGPVSEMKNAGQTQAQEMIEEMLEGLPEEQQEAMREAMEQEGQTGAETGPPVEVEVKKTGEKAVIAGHTCRRYNIYSGGQLAMELWLAKSVTVDKEVDVKKMVRMMAQLSEGGAGPSPLASPEVQALWEEGYPLRQVSHFMGQPSTIEAREVEEKSIPSEMFKAPADYQKVDSFMEVMF